MSIPIYDSRSQFFNNIQHSTKFGSVSHMDFFFGREKYMNTGLYYYYQIALLFDTESHLINDSKHNARVHGHYWDRVAF